VASSLKLYCNGAVGFIDWLDCINVLNFDLYPAEPLGQNVIDGSENDEEDETEDTHDDGHKAVDDSHDSERSPTEDNHWDADERVDKSQQDVHSGHYLARLQDRDADDLFCHGLWWLGRCFVAV
jgi:hypothetical protein